MAFASPEYLWFLPAIVLVALVALVTDIRRKRSLETFVEAPLVERIVRRQPAARRMAGALAMLTALVLMVFALMRPQWGDMEEERSGSGLDIVIAVDLSRSMLADDIQPSRLAAVKTAIGKLLDTLSGDRVSILAFAGTAFTVCPLTSDYAIVRQTVDELGPDTMPRGGSSISAALKEAERAFRSTPEQGRILMLISDGEDHAGEISPALGQLQHKGVMVLAAVAGTDAGGLMPLPGGDFVKNHQGVVVKSRAAVSTITGIDPAAVTIGSDGSGLEQLLRRARTTGAETIRTERRHRLVERFQLPLALAILMLCADWVMHRGTKE